MPLWISIQLWSPRTPHFYLHPTLFTCLTSHYPSGLNLNFKFSGETSSNCCPPFNHLPFSLCPHLTAMWELDIYKRWHLETVGKEKSLQWMLLRQGEKIKYGDKIKSDPCLTSHVHTQKYQVYRRYKYGNFKKLSGENIEDYLCDLEKISWLVHKKQKPQRFRTSVWTNT